MLIRRLVVDRDFAAGILIECDACDFRSLRFDDRHDEFRVQRISANRHSERDQISRDRVKKLSRLRQSDFLIVVLKKCSEKSVQRSEKGVGFDVPRIRAKL